MNIQTAFDFYLKNKDIIWKTPKIPEDLLGNLQIARWILNYSKIGWLELDMDIDVENWQRESDKSTFRLVPHRETDSKGWNSCCIHGIDVDKTGAWTNYGYTDESQVPYTWTSLSTQTPSIKSFWTDFPYESYRRIRFMQVEPNGFINPHSDAPGRLPGENDLDMLDFGVPINVAIHHPDYCYLSVEGYGVVPFKEGRAFVVNIRNYHSVINLSNVSRVHLISHGMPGIQKEEFAELVVRSYIKQYDKHSRI